MRKSAYFKTKNIEFFAILCERLLWTASKQYLKPFSDISNIIYSFIISKSIKMNSFKVKTQNTSHSAILKLIVYYVV